MDREPPKTGVKPTDIGGQGVPANLETLRRERSRKLFAAVEEQAIQAREAARLDKEARAKARRKARIGQAPEPEAPKIDTSGIARAQEEARMKRKLKEKLRAGRESGDTSVDTSGDASSTQPTQIESFISRRDTRNAVRDILMNTGSPEDDPEPPKSS